MSGLSHLTEKDIESLIKMLGMGDPRSPCWIESHRLLERLLSGTLPPTDALAVKKVVYALFIDFLHLIEPDGKDRRGIAHSRDGMRDVLAAAAEKSDFTRSATKQMTDLLDDFFADVQMIDADKQSLHVKPALKKNNPIAFFLRKYRLDIKEVGQSEKFPRWQVLCLALYRALRVAVDTPAETEANWHQRVGISSLAVLETAKYLPLEFLRDEDLPESLSKGAVADAMRIWFREDKPDFDTLELQCRRATRFFAGKRYSWEPYRKRKSRNGEANINSSLPRGFVHNSSADDADGDDGGGGKATKRLGTGTTDDIWTDRAQQQIEEGAAPAEFEAASELPRERLAVEGSAANSFALQPPNQTPSWAKSRLTAEILGVVLSWLESRARLSPENRFRQSILNFARLQILYGFSVSTLLDARFSAKWTARKSTSGNKGKKGKSKSEPIILYKNGIFTVRPSRQDGNSILAKAQTDKDVYENSGFDFDLVVPPPECESFDFSHRLPDDVEDGANQKTFASETLDNLFIVPAQSGKGWQPLIEKMVNSELKELSSELRKVIPAESKITAARIGASAATLLREHGLNELIAALVSGEIPRHLASQPFYTNLTEGEIRAPHYAALTSVLSEIEQRSISLREKLNLTASFEAFSANHTVTFTDNAADSPAISNFVPAEKRFGSPFVPRVVPLRGWLSDLRKSIGSPGKRRLTFNRFTAYSLLHLFLLTGMRPLEINALTARDASLGRSEPTLALLAKLNKSFQEWRTLELAPQAARQLAVYMEVADAEKTEVFERAGLSREQIEKRIGGAIFFYLRSDYTPTPLKWGGLKKFLSSEALGLSPFLWETNSPRHLYRTTAMRLGLTDKIIDALLGHATRGAEALGVLSVHDRLEEREAAERLAGHLENELELLYVRPNF